MTGGSVVILGNISDNFAAGMTGGMAYVYDPENTFENFVNPTSVIWQKIQTEYWRNKLLQLLDEFFKETNSKVAKKILNNFEKEIKNFIQVCPIEMLDKLENPINKDINSKKAI